MGKNRSPQALSKMLAYVLGRQPDEFGLIPDAEGFVRIKELLKALHEEADWRYVNLSHLNEVLLTVSGAPFELRDNRIRNLQRKASENGVENHEPPKLLYAAVRGRAYPHVQAEGIRPSSHPQVVLAADRDMAERLGRRSDPNPVILTVNVRSALAAGVVLVASGEDLFLADNVPPGCFSGPSVPADKPIPNEKPMFEKKRPRAETPGSFLLDPKKATTAHVPDSVKHKNEKAWRKGKHSTWTREQPPWKK